MRTAYIHLGTHKTGTTSIQGALRDGRAALQRNSLLYPRAGVPTTHAGHHNIGWQLAEDPRFKPEDGGVADLLREIGREDRDVVLSSEVFGVAVHDTQRFRGFVAELRRYTPRVMLIVYLRNQAAYARSLYLQMLRTGYQDTFADFLEVVVRDRIVRRGAHARYALCYRDYLALLPHQDAEVVVRHYDAIAPHTVTADFLSILGLTLGAIGMTAELRENPSLSLVEAVLRFYRARGGHAGDARVREVIGPRLAGKAGEIEPASHRRLLEAFAGSNAAVNARYGCALPTAAADLPPSDGPFLGDLFSASAMRSLDECLEP